MVLSLHPLSATAVHNVINFGARPNGVANTALAFLKAMSAACATVGPAVVKVPKWRYLLVG